MYMDMIPRVFRLAFPIINAVERRLTSKKYPPFSELRPYSQMDNYLTELLPRSLSPLLIGSPSNTTLPCACSNTPASSTPLEGNAMPTTDAAGGMQPGTPSSCGTRPAPRHPPNFAATAFIPDAQTDAAGNRQRFFHLTRNALPFLFMGQATKHKIRWMTETVRRTA